MKFRPRKPDWHYAPIGVHKSETDDSPLQHGSCVASKAAGAGYGVSKESRLIEAIQPQLGTLYSTRRRYRQ